MGFDATYIPAIMLIVVGVGWMLVWAFSDRGHQGFSPAGTPQSEHEEARNIHTLPGTLENYSWYGDASIRSLVGRNPSSSQSVLGRLASDDQAVVRMSVGQNPSTHHEILQVLAKDVEVQVRWGVAQNPTAPPDILQQLSLDRSDRVRQAAVANPRFTQVGPTSKVNAGSRVEALERLARLHQQGVLTEQELKAEKERLLGE